jgi:hypothetical protein
MSTLNLIRHDSVNQQRNKTAKVTPKSFKVFHDADEGARFNPTPQFTLFKVNGVYNRPINVIFPSGKVRQVVLLRSGTDGGVQTSDAVVGQSVLAHRDDKWFYSNQHVDIAGDALRKRYDGRLSYIQHKDDKVYDVFRWVIVRKGDRNTGTGQKVIYDLSLFNAATDKVHLIKEQWSRWGDKDICCDTGVAEKTHYFYDDPYEGMYPKWSRPLLDFSSKNVSEFPTNPFAEGDLTMPRYRYTMPQGGFLYVKTDVAADVAVKSFLWKREIAEAVFRPERVAKMIDRYGMEWIDEIA